MTDHRDGTKNSVDVGLYRPGPELTSVSEEVWRILEETDKDFFPSLASREGTTTKQLHEAKVWPGPIVYFESIMGQFTLLARIESEPVGLVSFIPGFSDELLDQWSPSAYVTTIAVRSSQRGHGIGHALCNAFIDLPEVVDPWLTTRTWSTNKASIKLFERAGFSEVRRLNKHRSEEVDTVYMARANPHI